MTTGDELLNALATAAQDGTPTPHQRAADIFLAPYLARIKELEDALAASHECAVERAIKIDMLRARLSRHEFAY